MSLNLREEEMRTYEALYSLQGARIRFKCDGVIYEGIINTIMPQAKLVRLRHTTIVGENKYLGQLRFRFSDIKSFTVVQSAEEVSPYPKNEYLQDVLKNKVGKGYSINNVFFNGELSEESECEDDKKNDEEFVLDFPPHVSDRLPQDNVIIDSINKDFQDAVNHIKQRSVIGVSFEGPQVSRFGKLIWVCISTSHCVFLFDIDKLKDNAFINGLKYIFEEKSIKKVVHDCRFPSDCLAHVYSTELTNVFDTQIADFVACMQRYNDKIEYKFVSSLDNCIRKYLDVPPAFLFQREKGLSAVDKNTFYSKRPISNAFRYDLTKNVLYLMLLQEELYKELLGPLHKTVNSYLTVLADATKEEIDNLGSELSSPDRIPSSLLLYGIQTARFQKPEKKPLISLECKFHNPVSGDIIIPKKILYSHDRVEELMCDVNKSSDKVIDQRNNIYPKNIITVHKNTTNDVESISIRPSHRHIDEVFHKLVNSQHLSHQSQNIINVKPLDNYVSKFSFKKPFSICTNSDTDSSAKDDTSGSEYSINMENILETKQEFSDFSETWEKLRANAICEHAAVSSNRKVCFIPG